MSDANYILAVRTLDACLAERNTALADLDTARADLAVLREALALLVQLHDGPRDADYERGKPWAWQAARVLLAGPAPAEETR